MELSLFAAFWAVSILFIITPGIDWAYAIAAGIQGRVVLPAVTGLLLGHFLATMAVAAGVGVMVAREPMLLAALTWIGSAYLLWIGVNMLLYPSVPTAHESQDRQSGRHWFLKGACVSGLNPKVFLLFLALLPQFTDPNGMWPVSVQIMALGLIHIISCACVYLCVGYCSRRVLQSRPGASQWVSRFSGIAMILIALFLISGPLNL